MTWSGPCTRATTNGWRCAASSTPTASSTVRSPSASASPRTATGRSRSDEPLPGAVHLPAGAKAVLDRRSVLLALAAGGGKAADVDLVGTGVDAQEALEHRRLVPVQPLREQIG